MKAFILRRSLLAMLLALPFAAVQAQNFPERPIRLIIPFAPASGTDLIARAIAKGVTEGTGAAVIIDNRPGGEGFLGSQGAARGAPDGYTLLMAGSSTQVVNVHLFKKLPYDPIKDFEPITQLVSSGTVLVVRTDFPPKTLAELMAYAKAHPGKVAYGSVGVGSTTHLAGVMLSQLGHVEMTHVPYRGSAQINTDLLAGQIQMAFVNIAGVVPLIKDGQLRALAVSTLKRTSVLPDVPAVAETMPGFEVNSWYGLMAPAHTPAAIVHKLQSETAAILKMPEVAARMRENGLDIEGTTPEAYGQKIKEDLVRWAATVKAAGIKE